MASNPLAPITIRSAWCVEATSMISSAGLPSSHTGSAVNPALISFRTLCSLNLFSLLQPWILDGQHDGAGPPPTKIPTILRGESMM